MLSYKVLGGSNLTYLEEDPMFFTTKIENTKAKLQSMKASAVKWTKRFTLGCAIAGAIVVSSVYATVQTMIPHTHNIYSAAKLIVGESRGESYEGQKAVFGSILTRMADRRFPSTMHGVTYQPYSNNTAILQYNAMGDTLHEDLSTKLGQSILLRTAWWYAQNEFGIFSAPVGAQEAHSYCTPEACDRQKGYFGTLTRIGQIGNHVFYGDPKSEIGTVIAGTTAAPQSSSRPISRPQSIVLSEQVGQQIEEAIALVMAEAE